MATTPIRLAVELSVAACIALPAWACTIAPPPPRLSGESNEAYEARIGELNYKRELEWARARQAQGLKRADLIFIARDTAAPYRISTTYRPRAAPVKRPRGAPVRRTRLGAPLPVPVPVPPVLIEFPAPAYYRPIDWFRGAPSTRSFQVQRSMTTCGIISIGDTSDSEPRNLYLFFANKGPLSEKTLIDAIALNKIDDPALLAFVAKYRSKAQAPIR